MRAFSILFLMLVALPLNAEVPANVFRDYSAEDLCADVAEDMSAGRVDVLKASFDGASFLKKAIPSNLNALTRMVLMEQGASAMEKGFFSLLVDGYRVWYFEMRPDNAGHKVCQLSARAGNGVLAFDFIIEMQVKRPVIVDFYDHVAGMLRSTLMRKRLILSIPESAWENGRGWRDIGPELEESDRLNVQRFLFATAKKDLPLIRETYKSLTPSMQADFTILSSYAMSVETADADYEMVLGRLAKSVSNVSDLSLMLADYYVIRGDKQKLRELIPVVTRNIAGRAPGKSIVIGLAKTLGDDELLHTLLRDALESDDGEKDLYWLIVDESVKRGDYRATLLAFDVLKKHFYFDFSAISQVSKEGEEFKRFLSSSEFKAWQSRN